MSERTISILVADDHEIVRKGLVNVLSLFPELKVVAEAEDGVDTIEKAVKCSPDVVLLDIEMPRLSGTEAIVQLRRKMPQTRIIALSGHDDQELVARMVQAGAHGYLLKTISTDALREAIRTVAAGKKAFSASVTSAAQDAMRSTGQTAPAEPLTDRERQLLQLIAQGNNHQQIADLLCISVRTVDTHRQNIQRKLDIHDGAGLIRYAIRKGIAIRPK